MRVRFSQNMDKIIIALSLSLLWSPGFFAGTDVTQTPILWKNKGDNNATIHCSHTKGESYFQMYWFRQLPGETMELIVLTTSADKDLDFGDFSKEKFSAEKPDARSGTFTVKNLESGDKGMYFCAVSLQGRGQSEAYFGAGTKLTVLEYDVKEPTVEVFRPSSKQCLNLKSEEKEKTLLCVASDFYPDHISVSWESGGVAVTTGVATDSFAAQDGKYYRISSRLRVNAEDWYEKEYECIVTFFNGTNYNIHKADIYGEEAPKDFHIREKYLRATQTAKLSYAVFIIKSSIYGAFVAFLVWKLKGSSGKQNG